jgi:hypothetical protein
MQVNFLQKSFGFRLQGRDLPKLGEKHAVTKDHDAHTKIGNKKRPKLDFHPYIQLQHDMQVWI